MVEAKSMLSVPMVRQMPMAVEERLKKGNDAVLRITHDLMIDVTAPKK